MRYKVGERVYFYYGTMEGFGTIRGISWDSRLHTQIYDLTTVQFVNSTGAISSWVVEARHIIYRSVNGVSCIK